MNPAIRQVPSVTAATRRARLEVALSRLPPVQLQALRLLRGGGLSYEEIGATLGLPLDDLRRLLWRARERLRLECFGPDSEAPRGAGAAPRLRAPS